MQLGADLPQLEPLDDLALAQRQRRPKDAAAYLRKRGACVLSIDRKTGAPNNHSGPSKPR